MVTVELLVDGDGVELKPQLDILGCPGIYFAGQVEVDLFWKEHDDLNMIDYINCLMVGDSIIIISNFPLNRHA